MKRIYEGRNRLSLQRMPQTPERVERSALMWPFHDISASNVTPRYFALGIFCTAWFAISTQILEFVRSWVFFVLMLSLFSAIQSSIFGISVLTKVLRDDSLLDDANKWVSSANNVVSSDEALTMSFYVY